MLYSEKSSRSVVFMTKYAARTAFVVLGISAAPLLVGSAFAQATTSQSNGVPGQTSDNTGVKAHAAEKHFSNSTIDKTGHALKKIAMINHKYQQKALSEKSMTKKRQIMEIARKKSMEALQSENITAMKYDEVISAARRDKNLRHKVLAAAGYYTTKK